MAHFWVCHRAGIVHGTLSSGVGGPGALDQGRMGSPEGGG